MSVLKMAFPTDFPPAFDHVPGFGPTPGHILVAWFELMDAVPIPAMALKLWPAYAMWLTAACRRQPNLRNAQELVVALVDFIHTRYTVVRQHPKVSAYQIYCRPTEDAAVIDIVLDLEIALPFLAKENVQLYFPCAFLTEAMRDEVYRQGNAFATNLNRSMQWKT